MSVSLTQILELVGELDDEPGEETPRERFRKFLKENIKKAGQIRDYVQECLRKTGVQYNRALQDLVNHIGRLLEFEVTFGRYQGVPGGIGFEENPKSPITENFVVVTVTGMAIQTQMNFTILNYALMCIRLIHFSERGRY